MTRAAGRKLRKVVGGVQARGGIKNCPTGGLTLPTWGLKYSFQGTINAKNVRKCGFHLLMGGKHVPMRAIDPSPPLAPPLFHAQLVFKEDFP